MEKNQKKQKEAFEKRLLELSTKILTEEEKKLKESYIEKRNNWYLGLSEEMFFPFGPGWDLAYHTKYPTVPPCEDRQKVVPRAPWEDRQYQPWQDRKKVPTVQLPPPPWEDRTVQLPKTFPRFEQGLDDDTVVQHDLSSLWELDLNGEVVGAAFDSSCGDDCCPGRKYKYCFNFTSPIISSKLDYDRCAWLYGKNVFDLQTWRKTSITATYHHWLKLVYKHMVDFIEKVHVFLAECPEFFMTVEICNLTLNDTIGTMHIKDHTRRILFVFAEKDGDMRLFCS
ncbi:hypothetical protein H5410_056067 [Solanum commersonii]|uniref:Hexosyltransferase n=1 Tax=Solanum commersonii TaxID=4109 RepID=A0A9J5WKL7_SOLCO|nr:hypothetical protein H5410_056067 [Solanum commersonii]